MVQVRVEQRREEIVRGGDRVEIAREVEVDVLHRHDLGVPAARRPALHAEHGAERRLAHAQDRLLPQPAQCLRHTDRHGGLPLPRGRGTDAGDEHEAALRLAPLQGAQDDFRLVLAVQLDLLVLETQFGGDVGDRPELRGLRDRDIGGDFGGRRHSTASSRGPKHARAFSVVRRASAGSASPHSAAARAATSRTYAGSLRRPRYGTGAR